MTALTKRERSEKPIAIGLRLDRSLIKRVQALATEYGRSKQEVYEAAIEAGLEQLEAQSIDE
jgi:predicted transcriptional regulator